MKKHVIGLFMGLLLAAKCGGQGWSHFPLLPHPKLEESKRPLLITCIDNYYSQSNLNGGWVEYYQPVKGGGIYGGVGLKILSTIKSHLGHLGVAIQAHSSTTLFSEFVYYRESFPEAVRTSRYHSYFGFKYNRKNFSILYEHFLNWNKGNSFLDIWRPIQQLSIHLKNGNDHVFTIVGQQYQQIPPQLILQEELKLSERWSMSAGIQWPLVKYHLSLKHSTTKWQVFVCVLAQPQFPPSFNQLYTYALD